MTTEQKSALDKRLNFHAEGCGVYLLSACDCLCTPAEAELATLRKKAAMMDAMLDRIERVGHCNRQDVDSYMQKLKALQ